MTMSTKIQIQNKLTCCYLNQTLSKINNVWKENNELWFIEVIWQKLEKDKKLCEKCL